METGKITGEHYRIVGFLGPALQSGELNCMTLLDFDLEPYPEVTSDASGT